MTAGAGVVAEADADAWLKEAQEANERWERTAAELLAENARLREELAPRDTEIEQMAAELAILKRLLFGRSSERARRTRRAVTGSWRPAVRAAGLLASAPSVVAGAGLLVVRVRVAGR